MQKLQNRAARVVTNSSNDQSLLPLTSQLGWLTVKEMIDLETAFAVYKVLQETCTSLQAINVSQHVWALQKEPYPTTTLS